MGGSGSDPGSAEDLGSLADLTADSVSDSASLTSVAPTIEPQPTFSPTESPPPGYMSEDGDSHDLPDITDYSGVCGDPYNASILYKDQLLLSTTILKEI